MMVDHLAPNRSEFEIIKENGRELNSNLVCTDSGHNKFYIMQIMKKSSSSRSSSKKAEFRFYRRWGRCGTDGQKIHKDYAALEEAIADYDTLLDQKLESYTEIHVTYP